MSGFGFGGFDLSNLGNLNEIGGRLQKFREDVENTIDASLRTEEEEQEGVGEAEEDGNGWLGGLDVLKNFVNLEDEEDEEGTGEEGKALQKEEEERDEMVEASVQREFEVPSNQEEVGTATVVAGSRSMETNKGKEAGQEQEVGEDDGNQGELESSKGGGLSTDAGWKDDDGFEDVDIGAGGEKKGTVDGQVGIHQKDKEEKVMPSQVEQNRAVGSVKESTVTESKKKKKKKKKNSNNSTVTTEQEKLPVAVAAKEQDKKYPEKDKTYSEMEKKIQVLESIIKERESQLERKAEEVAEAKRVTDAVVKKNEELAMTQASISELDLENMRRDYETQISELDEHIESLKSEMEEWKLLARKEREMERALKEKDAEIQEFVAEGEKLSKKQLNLETTIKQLRTRVSTLQTEAEENVSIFEQERQMKASIQEEKKRLEEALSMEKEAHVSQMTVLKAEHDKVVKDIRSSLSLAEKKTENLEKAGASRKLREAESRCEALQESLESLREEMARQREIADEREDLLSAELTALQQRCSEAEARQSELQNKLPEATAPLIDEINALREKMETAEQSAVISQKELMTKIREFEGEREEMNKRLESTAEAHEEAQRRLSALTSQLKEAQSSSIESERIAADERKARANAEAGWREAKSELSSMEASMASMEKLFNSQIEAMAAKESSSKEQIRSLEEEVQSLKSQIETLQVMSADMSPKQPNEKNLAVSSVDSKLGRDSPNIDRDTDFLARKLKDLEATRDKLSAALVLAEQKMAEGHAAKARVDSMSQELTDMRRKLAAAMELLGEREETIEELKEDLFDVRQGYKDQLLVMANQVDRLNKKIDVLSPGVV